MGYKVLGRTEDLMQGYEPWDPRTDFYLSNQEALEMYKLT
jgi:hypothetical protein